MDTFPLSSLSRSYTQGTPHWRKVDSGVVSMPLGIGQTRIRDALGQPIWAVDCRLDGLTAADKTTIDDFYDNHRASQFYWLDPVKSETYTVTFDPQSPPDVYPTANAPGRYEADLVFVPAVPTAAVGAVATGTPYDGGDTMITVIDLAAGADITALPVFVCTEPDGIVIDGAWLLSQGTPAGIDNSNTVVLTVADGSGNTVLTKTYNTANQPPTSDAEDLTAQLDSDYTELAQGDILKLTVTQGATANLPACQLYLRRTYA